MSHKLLISSFLFIILYLSLLLSTPSKFVPHIVLFFGHYFCILPIYELTCILNMTRQTRYFTFIVLCLSNLIFISTFFQFLPYILKYIINISLCILYLEFPFFSLWFIVLIIIFFFLFCWFQRHCIFVDRFKLNLLPSRKMFFIVSLSFNK